MALLLSSSELHRSLVALLLFIVAMATATAAQQPLAQYCPDSVANYTANSTFQSNLNALFSSLAANASASGGFLNITAGDVPDRAYGLVLCRGDVDGGRCSSCLATAAEGILQACPYKKSAVIWYDDCMLRHSYQRFFSSLDTGFRLLMWNEGNLTETARFNQQVGRMMTQLVRYAADNASARMFATGAASYIDPASPKIYGLVQCTRDLSAADCADCLTQITEEIPARYSGRRGARTLTYTCNMRYELYTFYNSSEMVSVPLSTNATPPTAPLLPPPMASPTGEGEKKKKSGTVTVLAVVIPLGVALALISVICVCFCQRKAHRKIRYTTDAQEITTIESLLFDLSTLKAATGDFADTNKLGQGGFGSVYKGLLPNGQEIAVKRLSPGSGQGIEELKNEVVLLARLRHRNLVRLLGVCLEGEEKLLVYEFVPNRSLDNFLFDPTQSGELQWERRYKMVVGIARALQYLHEDSQHKIIHRDLKASNILLDAEMNPKISDFGLARLFGGDQTQASTTHVVGTFGYMAPEYAMRGHFSNKSDVFSFGVIVLEIVTGRKNTNFFDSGRSPDLLSFVWEHWNTGTAQEIIDPSLEGRYQRGEVMRCIQIGLLCVQESPANRPTMSSVVLMLSSYSASLQVPSRPAFFIGSSTSYSDVLNKSHDSSASTNREPTSKSPLHSRNEITITELEPR